MLHTCLLVKLFFRPAISRADGLAEQLSTCMVICHIDFDIRTNLALLEVGSAHIPIRSDKRLARAHTHTLVLRTPQAIIETSKQVLKTSNNVNLFFNATAFTIQPFLKHNLNADEDEQWETQQRLSCHLFGQEAVGQGHGSHEACDSRLVDVDIDVVVVTLLRIGHAGIDLG